MLLLLCFARGRSLVPLKLRLTFAIQVYVPLSRHYFIIDCSVLISPTPAFIFGHVVSVAIGWCYVGKETLICK